MKALIFTVCLLVRIQDVLSCSCQFPNMSLPKKYCEADYAIKVLIKSKFIVLKDDTNDPFTPPEGYYRIKVKKQFKLPEGVNLEHHTRLYTNSETSFCGEPYLLRRKWYLIAGKYYGGDLHVGMCSSIVKRFRPYRSLVRKPPTCPIPETTMPIMLKEIDPKNGLELNGLMIVTSLK